MEKELLDVINSVFFFTSSSVVWLNVIRLFKDKGIKGVRLIPGFFFSLSTIWGIYYYYELDQPWSVLGMVLMATANTSWIVLAIYYTIKEKNQGNQVSTQVCNQVRDKIREQLLEDFK